MYKAACLYLFAWVLFSWPVYGQHTIRITVSLQPGSHSGEPFFITGIFNRWNPGDNKAQMRKNEHGNYEIELRDIPSGLFEYKFTRGDWNTLEATSNGRLVAPRSAIITQDTTMDCVIASWRDDFPASTASANVHLLDSAFYIPQLDVYRKIWIYLPPDYASGQKSYPVLYMHDGQDIFDEATSAGRLGPLEWGVDEVLDSAAKPCIVVAIEHNAHKTGRLQEYFVYPNPENPRVFGREYLDFIVHDLKPYIDSCFRTLPAKESTWMAGGSMGGLVTLYAGLLYPDVFGRLGVLSPSVWQDAGNSTQEIKHIKNRKSVSSQRYYFYAGDHENRIKPDGSRVQMHKDVETIATLLQETAKPDTKLIVYPGGRHGAWYWRLAFPAFYEWISNH